MNMETYNPKKMSLKKLAISKKEISQLLQWITK